MRLSNISFGLFILMAACTAPRKSIHQVELEVHKEFPAPPVNEVKVLTGLDVLLDKRLEEIKGKTIGLVTNQSGIDRKGVPNYERLLELDDVNLKVIFSPEHGLFGEAADGKTVDYKGQKRTLPEIVSLYGKNRKPSLESLQRLDLIIYDIQDIGARPYTYISTLGLVMEAAAAAGVPVMVLDRPNPITGHHVGGPVLDLKYQSFVGYYPIPIQYGLTVGEIAKMIVGENWISGVPELMVIPLQGWNRKLWFDETDLPWTKPSPNIPDLETAILYPGLCLLQATNVSDGRGTQNPFKWIGAPWIDGKELAATLNKMNITGVIYKPITFTPVEIPGMANDPKFENKVCHGVESIIINREDYHSVNTGLILLTTLNNLYGEYFEYKESGLKRLLSDSDMIDRLINGKDISKVIEKGRRDFLGRVKPYLIYD